MTRPVIILGSGGHGRVVLDMLRILGQEVIAFTDSDPSLWGRPVDGVPVIGGDQEVLKHGICEFMLVIGLGGTGDNTPRRRLFEDFSQRGYGFATLVHPASTVSGTAAIKEGSVIMPGTVIQAGCRIGRNVIVNTGAVVDHDSILEDHAHIAPGAVLSGGVSVGCGAHVGTGAVVIQNIRVGEGALVAAGAVVVENVPPRTVVMGVPARERTRD